MSIKIRIGDFYSLNNKRNIGHRGRVEKIKNGRAKTIVVTHHKRTKINKKTKYKNIRLNKNPDMNDPRTAYALPEPQYTSTRKLGKHHPEMRVTDATDKSIFRNIGKEKKE